MEPDDHREEDVTPKRKARPPLEPIAVTVADACRISGLSRSEIYLRLADGSIKAVKSGRRTLVLVDSVREHLASLSAATFRAPKATRRHAGAEEEAQP
jgi:excisionase family DNA binding protein